MLKYLAVFFAVSILLFAAPSFAGVGMISEIYSGDNIPKPRVLEPNGDTVDLSGKKELIFKWSPHEGDISQRKYYDFRLYEGEQALGPGRILKKQVSPNKHQIAIESGVFKEGAIYTWSIRQKYRSGGKSQRSTNSFRVIGK